MLSILIKEFNDAHSRISTPISTSTASNEANDPRKHKIITWWEIGIVIFAMMAICLCVTIFDRINCKDENGNRSFRSWSKRKDTPKIEISKEEEDGKPDPHWESNEQSIVRKRCEKKRF